MPARPALLRPSLLYALGFGSVLAVVAWILIRSLAKAWHAPDSDEGYYVHFASQVQQHGLDVFPELFVAWNQDNIVSDVALDRPSWFHPPPYRLGYIVACAWWAELFGASIQSLSWLSTASHLAWALVNWVFARRLLGEAFALALASLCAFSPLLLGIARLALMDNFTVLWVTLSVWLFLELLERPQAWAPQIGFVAAFTLAILTKELSVFIVPPLAAAALIERFARQRPLPLWRVAGVLALPGLLALPLFVLAAGGVTTLWATIRVVLSAPATMPYAVAFCQGPWYRYLIDYLCLSPFPTLLALFGAGALLQRISTRQGVSTAELSLALLGAGLLAEQAPFIKNARYLMALELPLRFFALSLSFRLAERVWPRRSGLLVAFAVAGLCALDWLNFKDLFADVGGYDPLSWDLLKAREIIPRR